MESYQYRSSDPVEAWGAVQQILADASEAERTVTFENLLGEMYDRGIDGETGLQVLREAADARAVSVDDDYNDIRLSLDNPVTTA